MIVCTRIKPSNTHFNTFIIKVVPYQQCVSGLQQKREQVTCTLKGTRGSSQQSHIIINWLPNFQIQVTNKWSAFKIVQQKLNGRLKEMTKTTNRLWYQVNYTWKINFILLQSPYTDKNKRDTSFSFKHWHNGASKISKENAEYKLPYLHCFGLLLAQGN